MELDGTERPGGMQPRRRFRGRIVLVALALGFGQKTIAEGVEDQATLDLLKELGVDYAQGYHLGRPAPLDEAIPATAAVS